jgi:hypothetical protein
LAGLFNIVTGAIIFWNSRKAQSALDSLKTEHYTDKDIERVFKQTDKNNDGKIDTRELAGLCETLGLYVHLTMFDA